MLQSYQPPAKLENILNESVKLKTDPAERLNLPVRYNEFQYFWKPSGWFSPAQDVIYIKYC